MSWPDDNQPRYVVDAQPTVRVLDRAYCYRVVHEFFLSQNRRHALDLADTLAASLNREDTA